MANLADGADAKLHLDELQSLREALAAENDLVVLFGAVIQGAQPCVTWLSFQKRAPPKASARASWRLATLRIHVARRTWAYCRIACQVMCRSPIRRRARRSADSGALKFRRKPG